MSNVTKALALISTLSFCAIAAPSFADSSIKADFSFSRSAPVADTYSAFETTAKAACQSDRLKTGGMGTKLKAEKICVEDLMQKAVAASQHSALIAYHDQLKGQHASPTQFAERN